MKTILFLILLTSSTFYGCTPITQSTGNAGNPSKTLQLTDRTYESGIMTVLLYPWFGNHEDNLLPAIIPIGQQNLMLEFDDLSGQPQNYYARIIHCNYDWSKSTLSDLDFMTDFNEFPINNYEYSTDTHIPYIHYALQVPAVKLPGNYVLMVYRSSKDDVILTKRFMVFESRVAISREGNLIGAGTVADLNQQINFTINHKDMNILNPMQDVSVSIRQNQRWDNMALGLKPSFIRTNESELEYRFFDPDKMFKGGNEFRFFDIRSLNSPGRNVERIDKSLKPFEAYIFRDKSREHEAYAQYDDLNGQFIIDNFDFNDLSAANYVMVNFALASPPIDGHVYVGGELNYWLLNEDNIMYYDSVRGEYRARMLLKQGWYDYQYVVRSGNLPAWYFEGTHFETENVYEIFVYHRPFQPRADLLVGYIRFEENRR